MNNQNIPVVIKICNKSFEVKLTEEQIKKIENNSKEGE